MRIAHIGPTSLPIGYPRGGAVERRMIELAGAQSRSGHDVVVVSRSPVSDEAPRAERRAGDVAIADIACRSRRPVRDIELPVRAREFLRRFGPDVVHVHNNWATAAALAGLGTPTVLSFDYFRYRGSSRSGMRSAYRKAIQAYDLLLPVSEYCATGAASWWSIPRSDFRVLPNGVNVEQFQPDELRRAAVRRRWGLTDAVVIGYVGRVCEQKGTDLLVEAFRAVRSRLPQVALVVAGPAGQFGSTGGSSMTDGIRNAGGRWLGAVPESELADVFRCMDVCVMPTRQDEMFGMAAAEALSSGTPVVCSAQGGLPEVVPTTAGVLVPPSDAVALTDALVALCGDTDARARLSAAAPGAARRFSWESVAARADELYAQVGTV